eukprot:TRINITY_DN44407_c0_g1_i1.p1 TRINITY_DN44407_c0_g1~~TRINITY_DN44407_c0_g1_i1.p1  ORF type:complete len:291 (-),score=27.82 TRINITY_DN44407_c0_g1_i1:84-956(-)
MIKPPRPKDTGGNSNGNSTVQAGFAVLANPLHPNLLTSTVHDTPKSRLPETSQHLWNDVLGLRSRAGGPCPGLDPPSRNTLPSSSRAAVCCPGLARGLPGRSTLSSSPTMRPYKPDVHRQLTANHVSSGDGLDNDGVQATFCCYLETPSSTIRHPTAAAQGVTGTSNVNLRSPDLNSQRSTSMPPPGPGSMQSSSLPQTCAGGMQMDPVQVVSADVATKAFFVPLRRPCGLVAGSSCKDHSSRLATHFANTCFPMDSGNGPTQGFFPAELDYPPEPSGQCDTQKWLDLWW